jgi:hypothetical protein
MQDVGRTESENDPVKKGLEPGSGFAILEGDDDNISGHGVDQGQGLGLSRESRALALKVHAPFGSGGMGRESREQTVGRVLASFVKLAGGAIRQKLTHIRLYRGPIIGLTDESKDFSVG